uniref:Cardiolipin synthase (CMP-forming) n=1 Tax=Terrapene triunguis TaxID=2587831 RepID=A0A674JIB2_9SAUR
MPCLFYIRDTCLSCVLYLWNKQFWFLSFIVHIYSLISSFADASITVFIFLHIFQFCPKNSPFLGHLFFAHLRLVLHAKIEAEDYENPWTIPNILSLARIGLAPVLGYLIVEENFNIALGVFALAGITDLLDGFIARNWASQKSALGSALDPLADKILISVLYVSLTCASLIPVPLTTLIILRDIVLIAAVFYVRYKTLSPPRTLSRYFNPCYATAQLKPTFISKMNTAVQLILVAASLAAPVFDYIDSIYLQTLWCITAFTTAASAYSYYHYGRKTVQVINNK